MVKTSPTGSPIPDVQLIDPYILISGKKKAYSSILQLLYPREE